MDTTNGFYEGRYVGPFGQGRVLLALLNGQIAGIDVGGAQYAGSYRHDQKQGRLDGHISMAIPPGARMVTDGRVRSSSESVEFPVQLPADLDGKRVALQLPIGPVDVAFRKVSNLQQL